MRICVHLRACGRGGASSRLASCHPAGMLRYAALSGDGGLVFPHLVSSRCQAPGKVQTSASRAADSARSRLHSSMLVGDGTDGQRLVGPPCCCRMPAACRGAHPLPARLPAWLRCLQDSLLPHDPRGPAGMAGAAAVCGGCSAVLVGGVPRSWCGPSRCVQQEAGWLAQHVPQHGALAARHGVKQREFACCCALGGQGATGMRPPVPCMPRPPRRVPRLCTRSLCAPSCWWLWPRPGRCPAWNPTWRASPPAQPRCVAVWRVRAGMCWWEGGGGHQGEEGRVGPACVAPGRIRWMRVRGWDRQANFHLPLPACLLVAQLPA